jgi:hypothetical protein
MQGETVSGQRVAEVRNGVVDMTMLRHHADQTDDRSSEPIGHPVCGVERQSTLRRHRGGEIDGVTKKQGCRINVGLFSQSDTLFQ